MIKQNLAVLLLSTLTLTACAKTTNATLTPEVQEKVNKLLEKTKKNMIFVEGGTFMMGDFGHLSRKDKLPITGLYAAMPTHQVTLDSFSLNAYKTTFEDFDIYTEAIQQPKISMQILAKKFRQPNAPAGISWQQAKDYCQWLGEQIGIPMTLPTEAQWEYAARNKGKFIVYPTNNGEYLPGENVWSDEQRSEVKQKLNVYLRIPLLGHFPPSPLGFYDMATDNFEWMSDWYDDNYYKHSPEHNPQGPKTGSLKTVRSTRQQGSAVGLAIGGEVTTVYRRGMEPDPQFDKDDVKDENRINLNDQTSVRCVSNSPQPFSP